MATGLPPPPINDQPGSFTWLEWYRQLRDYISTNGSVPWYIINFAGSNITDIATRDHDQLQNLDGGTAGEHYHLTAAQWNVIDNGPSMFRATRTTDQTLTSASWTTVLFDSEEVDTNGWYVTSTGKFTPQIAGWFQVNLTIGIHGTNVTTHGISITKNATAVQSLDYNYYTASTGGQGMSTSALVYFNGTTDYIDGQVLVTGTSPKVDYTLPNYFSAHFVGTG